MQDKEIGNDREMRDGGLGCFIPVSLYCYCLDTSLADGTIESEARLVSGMER